MDRTACHVYCFTMVCFVLVDVGEPGRTRTVCSGLVAHVTLEQMQVGGWVGVVVNLIKSDGVLFVQCAGTYGSIPVQLEAS